MQIQEDQLIIQAEGTLPPPFSAGAQLVLTQYEGEPLQAAQVYLFASLDEAGGIVGLMMARVSYTLDGIVGLDRGTGAVDVFDLRSDRFDVAAHLTPTGAAHADVSLLTSPSPSP